MRIVFFGTPRVAVPSLEALVSAGHALMLVVTQPDRPVGRSRRPSRGPVKRAAERLGLELRQPTKLRRGPFVEELAGLSPELLVVVGYGRIFPGPMLQLAPRGAVNVHFSMLPKYRGAAPVQWALANGEPTTGVTTMQISEKLDEGDVLLQREVLIEPGEHTPALADRLAAIGAELLLSTLDRLEAGTLEPSPQDDTAASLAPQLSREDGRVCLGLDARAVEGRIRGFDPWPGVWVSRGGRRLRLVRASALERVAGGEPPGRIVALEDGVLALVCGGGSLLGLERIQPEGRRELSVGDAVNGRQIAPGDLLETPAG